MSKRALLAGATGLVGRELLGQLIASSDYTTVHVLVRRAAPALAASSKLVTHVVSFDDLPPLPATDDVFIALGTTIKVAKPGSRRWVPPTFITVGLLGVAWLVVYYVAGQHIPFMSALGNWNILIGMGGMAAAFGIATLWK